MDLLAAALMLLTASLYGSVVVLIYLSGPAWILAYTAWMRFVSAAVAAAFILLLYRGVVFQRDVLRFLGRRMCGRDLLVLTLAYFDFLFMVLAVEFAPPVIAAVAYEIWPFFFVIALSRFVGSAFVGGGWSLALGLVVAFVGVSLVVSGANGGYSGLAASLGGPRWYSVPLQLVFPLLGVLFTAMTCFIWVGSVRMSRRVDLPDALMVLGPERTRGLFLLLYPMCGWILSGLLTLGFLPLFEPVSALALGWGPWGWMALTALASALGGVCWRFASLATPSIRIHALAYLAPVFSTLLLLTLGLLEDLPLWRLFLGVALVLGANLTLLFPGVLRGAVLLVSGCLLPRRLSGVGLREDGTC